MGYQFKPGELGDIKDLVRKANEQSGWPWERETDGAQPKVSKEDASGKTASTAKKPKDTAKNAKGKRSGRSKKSSTDTVVSKSSKKPSPKPKSENSRPKNKVPPSNPSAGKSKSDKATSQTSGSLESLWNVAKASKAKNLKKDEQTQVWLNSELYRKIEMLNLKCDKLVPTKHLVNAILQLFLDEHKSEIAKAKL